VSLILCTYTLLISGGTHEGKIFRLDCSLKFVSSDACRLSCCSCISVCCSPETQAIMQKKRKKISLLSCSRFFYKSWTEQDLSRKHVVHTDGLQLFLITSQQGQNMTSYLAWLRWCHFKHGLKILEWWLAVGSGLPLHLPGDTSQQWQSLHFAFS